MTTFVPKKALIDDNYSASEPSIMDYTTFIKPADKSQYPILNEFIESKGHFAQKRPSEISKIK